MRSTSSIAQPELIIAPELTKYLAMRSTLTIIAMELIRYLAMRGAPLVVRLLIRFLIETDYAKYLTLHCLSCLCIGCFAMRSIIQFTAGTVMLQVSYFDFRSN